MIPLTEEKIQREIADEVQKETFIRNLKIDEANEEWNRKLGKCLENVKKM